MGVCVGVGSNVGVEVAVGVSVGSPVGVEVSMGVAVSIGVSVGISVGVAVGVEVAVSVAVGEGVSVGVGVGVLSAGSGFENLFWGWGKALITKSFALLPESSPFPLNSSIPPIFIESEVEEAKALRSMLVLAEGVATLAPSKSDAVPIPTSSIRL